MAYAAQNLKDAVDRLVMDKADHISDVERDEAITLARLQLNRDRPYQKVLDITGDGSQDYGLPATDFLKGVSIVRAVEHPAGETPPAYRDENDDWFVYEDPTATPVMRLRFKESTPTSLEKVRVTLSRPHADDATTLDDITFLAQVYFAVALVFRQLSARYGQSVDPTIAADAVDYGRKTDQYLFLAERYRGGYQALVGLAEGGAPAAQALGEVDLIWPHGEDFFWHPARRR